jgi:hypothetical protein
MGKGSDPTFCYITAISTDLENGNTGQEIVTEVTACEGKKKKRPKCAHSLQD